MQPEYLGKLSNYFNFSGFGKFSPNCWFVFLAILIMIPSSTCYAQLCNDVLLDSETTPAEWFSSFQKALSVQQYKSLRSFFFMDILSDHTQAALLCNNSESPDLTQNWTVTLKEIQGNFVVLILSMHSNISGYFRGKRNHLTRT